MNEKHGVIDMKKHYSQPEKLLDRLISGLESTDRERIAAVEELLFEGPLGLVRLEWPSIDVSAVGEELLRFIRALVHETGRDQDGRAADLKKSRSRSTRGPSLALTKHAVGYRAITLIRLSGVSFAATLEDDRVQCAVDGELRDVALLQLIMLLDRVGLRNVRGCSALDCERIYVKTYRREFCSVQCQKRVYARQMRGRERELRERRRRARQRRQRGE